MGSKAYGCSLARDSILILLSLRINARLLNTQLEGGFGVVKERSGGRRALTGSGTSGTEFGLLNGVCKPQEWKSADAG
jgi:hypothetical protein